MATAVEKQKTKGPSHRKRQHSSELLQPPKGPGVAFLMQELGGKSSKKPCVLEGSLMASCDPPRIFKVEQSSVLGRVQSFLPQLEKADQELRVRLKSQPQGDHNYLDIENVKEGEACIEMDLAVVPILTPDSDDDDSDSDTDTSDCEQQNFMRTCTRTSTHTELHNNR